MTEQNNDKIISNINLAELTARLMKLVIELGPEEKIALLRDLEDRVGVRKRKTGRMPYLAEIDFAMNGKPVKGYIMNISQSGLYIQCTEKPKEGVDITMTFPPPSKNESIKISGRVVRSEDDGFAVEFQSKLNESLRKFDTKIFTEMFIK